MQLTWYDSNSWLIEMAGKRILLDPWLVGDLIFGNLSWLIKGTKKTNFPIPENIDLILLSQGLEDHAHPETLKILDRNIPVVASPNAEKVVKGLGYTQITSLAHHQTYTFANRLQIKAVPGSPIGPQLVENGYILKDLETGQNLYYEPHGYHSPSIKQDAPIDVLLTPVVGITFLGLIPFLKGQKKALELCQWVQPQYILQSAAGNDTDFEGVLTSILQPEGTIEAFRQLLTQNNLSTQVLQLKPGEPFTPELKQRNVISV
ncbi:conserved hypothetical protein [Gloeothece citriformis PCC 7424]|uniref:MBL fold metallo-hydrolase n=1 Tax=Gloeothece citriformis (strain PCC 7424) TaxID=65393 RepID=B7K7M2_GLOC7|nr:MBL fold metallo-hydrolase [Gloeothece citriformis]ACK69790.1 conserved hypothetical protein [Gloeothece citriformis PCC 7424]